MRDLYILNGKVAVPFCGSFAEWAMQVFGSPTLRQVAFDAIRDVEISTIFLGSNHHYGGNGPPLLFETLVGGGPHNGATQRYSTWEEAEVGHREMVTMVRRGSHTVIEGSR